MSKTDIDSIINSKMRKARFINKKGIAVTFGVSLCVNKDEIIVVVSNLLSEEKAMDYVSSSLPEISSWIFNNALKKFSPDQMVWLQHFPSSKGYAATIDFVLLIWDKKIECFKLEERRNLDEEAISRLAELMQSSK